MIPVGHKSGQDQSGFFASEFHTGCSQGIIQGSGQIKALLGKD